MFEVLPGRGCGACRIERACCRRRAVVIHPHAGGGAWHKFPLGAGCLLNNLAHTLLLCTHVPGVNRGLFAGMCVFLATSAMSGRLYSLSFCPFSLSPLALLLLSCVCAVPQLLILPSGPPQELGGPFWWHPPCHAPGHDDDPWHPRHLT